MATFSLALPVALPVATKIVLDPLQLLQEDGLLPWLWLLELEPPSVLEPLQVSSLGSLLFQAANQELEPGSR